MIYHQFLTIGQFLFSVSFMIDYIKFLFQGNFHMRCEETFI